MAVLDENKDGLLKGTELRHVWLWLDANGSARIDSGEVKPVSHYVRSLNTRATVDAAGNAEAPQGAEDLQGKPMRTWDWWSRPWPLDNETDYFKATINSRGLRVNRSLKMEEIQLPKQASIYYWSQAGKPESGGFLRFVTVKDQLYVISSPMAPSKKRFETLVYARVIGSPSSLAWEFAGIRRTAQESTTATLLDFGKLLLGKAQYYDLQGSAAPFKYEWTAELVKPNELPEFMKISYARLLTFTDEEFGTKLAVGHPDNGEVLVPHLTSRSNVPFQVSCVPFKMIK